MGRSKSELSYCPSEGRQGRPRKLVVDGKQQCSSCQEWKPLDDFYPAKHTFNGRETRCSVCTRSRVRDYNNSDVKRWMKQLLASHLKRRNSARRSGFVADSCITLELLTGMWKSQSGKCAITGKPMTHIHGQGSLLTNASIDRINNGLGYVDGNVRLVCRAANSMKYTMSDTEMIDWCKAVLDGPLCENLQSLGQGKNWKPGLKLKRISNHA